MRGLTEPVEKEADGEKIYDTHIRRKLKPDEPFT